MCRNELISPGTHQLLLWGKKVNNRDLDSLQVMLVSWWLLDLAGGSVATDVL